MKAIKLIVFTILFSLFLTACQTDKTDITVTYPVFSVGVSNVIFTADIDDPNELITGDLTVTVFDEAQTIVFTETFTSQEDLVDYSITLSDNTIEYTLKLFGTSGRENLLLSEKTFTLASPATIEIASVEDFLAMNSNTSGNYILMNDLDFSGVDFVSPFSTKYAFMGTFDGNGHALKNIMIDEITTYTGVFGYVTSGRIHDLTLDHVYIGTEEEPLTYAVSSRVGLLSGYVSSTSGSFNDITVMNSGVYFQSNSTYLTYVGGLFGEFRGQLDGAHLDEVNVQVKATSYADLHVGGAIGLLGTDATVKNVSSHADVDVEFVGNRIKDRDIFFTVGGLIGRHDISNKLRAVENLFVMGDVTVNADFGTLENTTKGNYSIYVGGIAGMEFNNFSNALYGGSITFYHEKNAFEDQVNKDIYIGGLLGYYGSSKLSQFLVRYSDQATINIHTSDDVNLFASQIFGGSRSSIQQNAGVHGDASLLVNMVEESGNDPVTMIDSLVDYFESDFVQEAVDSLVG